jgi:hypothetical protein
VRVLCILSTNTKLQPSIQPRCSARVRSGFAPIRAGNHYRKAAPFTEGLPGSSLASTSPVSWRRFSQRLIVAGDTPKSSRAYYLQRLAMMLSRIGDYFFRPCSTAPVTSTRGSSEE